MRGLPLLVMLLLFWASLSGAFSNWFLVGSGLVTAGLVTLVVHRWSNLAIGDWTPTRMLGLIRYMPWLSWQVLLANLRVLRVIWTPKLPIDPRLVEVPCTLETGTARALYANSITLTPGTVTVSLQADQLLVHALTPHDAEGVQDGSMHARIKRLEPSAP